MNEWCEQTETTNTYTQFTNIGKSMNFFNTWVICLEFWNFQRHTKGNLISQLAGRVCERWTERVGAAHIKFCTVSTHVQFDPFCYVLVYKYYRFVLQSESLYINVLRNLESCMLDLLNLTTIENMYRYLLPRVNFRIRVVEAKGKK